MPGCDWLCMFLGGASVVQLQKRKRSWIVINLTKSAAETRSVCQTIGT